MRLPWQLTCDRCDIQGPLGRVARCHRKRAKNGRFRSIFMKRRWTPLEPPFATPPFAAAPVCAVSIGDKRISYLTFVYSRKVFWAIACVLVHE